MNRLQKKANNKIRRKNRVRHNIFGNKDRPRLSVSISNAHVEAQVIDDEKGQTLAHATSFKIDSKKTMTEKAEIVGSEIAKLAKAKKVKKVVFDRNGRIYHGRVKALAEAARKEGLEF